jgi:lysophospholipase L1-like esterase
LSLWIAAGLLASFVAAMLVHLLRVTTGPPDGGPEEFLNRPRMSGETLVACLGDSHTHGRVGADWVGLLRRRMGMEGWLFINAGRNGDLAWNLGQRLEPVIRCDPDFAVILIGSNDLMAACHPGDAAEYVVSNGLPRTPGIDWYERQLREIVHRLKEATHAEIILCTLPPLGEDPPGEWAGVLAAHNAVVGMLGRVERLTVLPVHRMLAAEVKEPGPAYIPGDRKRPIFRALLRRYLLGRTWDQAGEAGGYSLLTDGIHLGDRAAGMLSVMVEEHLRGRAGQD